MYLYFVINIDNKMDIIGRKLLVADLDALVSRIGLRNNILYVVTGRGCRHIALFLIILKQPE